MRGYSFQFYRLENSFRQNVTTLKFQNETWWWNVLVWRKRASGPFPKVNVLSPIHTYQDLFENGEFIFSGMSSSNTCKKTDSDFPLHSLHSASNCKCWSSPPYFTQTRPIISFYFSKTVPVLPFLIFATVLTDFAKRLFYSNSTCTSCSLLLKSCCSFWMVAFFSVWTRVKSLEASCRYRIQQKC